MKYHWTNLKIPMLKEGLSSSLSLGWAALQDDRYLIMILNKNDI